jgi:hypothetical protein
MIARARHSTLDETEGSHRHAVLEEALPATDDWDYIPTAAVATRSGQGPPPARSGEARDAVEMRARKRKRGSGWIAGQFAGSRVAASRFVVTHKHCPMDE